MSIAVTTATSHPPNDRAARDATALLGMWVFLASELLFFGGLFLAWFYGHAHWPQGFAAAGRHTDVGLGTLNTALLLSSSALVALAVDGAARTPRRAWPAALLAAAALLGAVFLAIKGVEYRQDWHEGLFPGPRFALAGQPGAALFFMLYTVMTALHALHLLIGVGLLATFAWGRARRADWAPQRRLAVVGLYWHFVDIVWIFLYPLLYLDGRAS